MDRAFRQLPNASIDLFQKIFDSRIAPILLYGSEIRGMDNCNIIEGTHLLALKRFLNVPIITPNVFVYGDTGRHELYIKSVLSSIKYWIKFLKMNNYRIVRKVYNMMLLNEHENSWVSKVKNILFYCNLQETWQTKTVGIEREFLEVLKEKLIYFCKQKWIETIQSSRRYDVYKSFKPFRYK